MLQGIIFGNNVSDKIFNKNLLELLFLLLVALVLLLKSHDKIQITYFSQTSEAFSFNGHRKLFFLNTPSLILISIIFLKLFL